MLENHKKLMFRRFYKSMYVIGLRLYYVYAYDIRFIYFIKNKLYDFFAYVFFLKCGVVSE